MVQQVVNSVKQALLVSLLSLASFACADADDVNARMELAEAKYRQAQEAGFAWRANRLTLEKARMALSNGDENASVLVEEAIKLADASLSQAAREAEEWNTRFPFAGQ